MSDLYNYRPRIADKILERKLRSKVNINCAVIDKRIGWYGNVNFIGHSIADSNAIRMQ